MYQDVGVVTTETYTVSFDILRWEEEGTVEFTVTVGGVTVFDEGDYTGSGTYTFENVQPTSTGNLIFYAYADEASTLGVDIDNVSVKKEGGEVDFKYDYLGRRVEKTIHDSQTTIHYTYDGDQVIAEYEGSTLKRKFV